MILASWLDIVLETKVLVRNHSFISNPLETENVKAKPSCFTKKVKQNLFYNSLSWTWVTDIWKLFQIYSTYS